MAVMTDRLGEAATAAADSATETAKSMGKAADRIRDELGETERRVRQIVEEYPFSCFVGAVVAGYLIGRLATRT